MNCPAWKSKPSGLARRNVRMLRLSSSVARYGGLDERLRPGGAQRGRRRAGRGGRPRAGNGSGWRARLGGPSDSSGRLLSRVAGRRRGGRPRRRGRSMLRRPAGRLGRRQQFAHAEPHEMSGQAGGQPGHRREQPGRRTECDSGNEQQESRAPRAAAVPSERRQGDVNRRQERQDGGRHQCRRIDHGGQGSSRVARDGSPIAGDDGIPVRSGCQLSCRSG